MQAGICTVYFYLKWGIITLGYIVVSDYLLLYSIVVQGLVSKDDFCGDFPCTLYILFYQQLSYPLTRQLLQRGRVDGFVIWTWNFILFSFKVVTFAVFSYLKVITEVAPPPPHTRTQE